MQLTPSFVEFIEDSASNLLEACENSRERLGNFRERKHQPLRFHQLHWIPTTSKTKQMAKPSDEFHCEPHKEYHEWTAKAHQQEGQQRRDRPRKRAIFRLYNIDHRTNFWICIIRLSVEGILIRDSKPSKRISEYKAILSNLNQSFSNLTFSFLGRQSIEEFEAMHQSHQHGSRGWVKLLIIVCCCFFVESEYPWTS